jgi:hypothetical protein
MMDNLYTVHFFGGPKHRESIVCKLLPEIRFPVMEDIKIRIASTRDRPPNKTRYHVYERHIGTVDYVYKGIE